MLGRQRADGQGGLGRRAGLLEDRLRGFADVMVDGVAVADPRCGAVARLPDLGQPVGQQVADDHQVAGHASRRFIVTGLVSSHLTTNPEAGARGEHGGDRRRGKSEDD